MEIPSWITEIMKRHTTSDTQYNDPVYETAERYNNTPGKLTGYDCPECNNKGDRAVVKNGVIEAEICVCMTIRNNFKHIEDSGLSDIARRYTLENYKTSEEWQKKAKSLAESYISTHGDNWFYIGGESGSGKTHLCTGIATELAIKGIVLKYIVWREEIVKIKANINNADNYQKQMDELKDVPLLCIDDFLKMGGNAKPTEADLTVAFELINYRYSRNNLLTVFSSEYTLSQIMSFDKGIGGRINERAGEFILNISPDIKKNHRIT